MRIARMLTHTRTTITHMARPSLICGGKRREERGERGEGRGERGEGRGERRGEREEEGSDIL